jgi:hypothetical protein
MVATRLDSVCVPGRRSGAGRKTRLNRGQEIVMGQTLGEHTPTRHNILCADVAGGAVDYRYTSEQPA